MDPTVRRATENDIADTMPLWKELLEFHADLDPRFQLAPDAVTQAEEHLRAELAAVDRLLVVATHGPAVVGFCRASIRQRSTIFERRVHGFISEFYVAEPFRRKGIGRKLFQFVQPWLKQHKISDVELVNFSANDESDVFWGRLGFESYAVSRSIDLNKTESPPR